MSDKKKREINAGYEIKESILFEDNCGIALAENQKAPASFVTWQFNQKDNGKRDYYWGHYKVDEKSAKSDYIKRVTEYQKDNFVAEKSTYKYYSTQRPVDIGTFPKEKNNELVRIVNFDERTRLEQGKIGAWGFLEYRKPLTEKQIDDYELKAAPGNAKIEAHTQDKKPRRIADQLAEAEKKVERGDNITTDEKQEHDER